MLDQGTILELLDKWGYLVVFVAGMAEAVPFIGMFIPGQAVIITAGFLAAQGALDFWRVLIAAIVAGVIGDAVSYYIGVRKGRAFLLKYGPRFRIREHHIVRADSLFARYGAAALILARFSFVTRGLAALLAGITRMRQRVFWPLNIAGAILWSFAYTGMGFLFGGSVRVLQGLLGGAIAGVIALVVVAYVVVRLVKRWRRIVR